MKKSFIESHVKITLRTIAFTALLLSTSTVMADTQSATNGSCPSGYLLSGSTCYHSCPTGTYMGAGGSCLAGNQLSTPPPPPPLDPLTYYRGVDNINLGYPDGTGDGEDNKTPKCDTNKKSVVNRPEIIGGIFV